MNLGATAALRETAGPIPYDVRLPEAGLGWEKMGPLFERYSVALVGSVDLPWAEAYKRVVATAPGLGRFRLDADHAIVSFTCRSTDGPVQVMAVLKILAGMVERVNREASLAAARLPTELDPLVGETDDSRRSNGGARSLRGALFTRSTDNSK